MEATANAPRTTPTKFYAPEAVFAHELEVDDLVVFDAFYGAERVAQLQRYTQSFTGVDVVHLGVVNHMPGREDELLRFIVRGAHESVTCWRETPPRALS